MGCGRTLLASSATCRIERCACGTLHVSLGPMTLRLEREAASDLAVTLLSAVHAADAPRRPRPHEGVS